MKREIKPAVVVVVVIVLVVIIAIGLYFMTRKPTAPQSPNEIPVTPTKMPGPAPPGVTPEGPGGGQTPGAGGPAGPTQTPAGQAKGGN